MAEWVEPALVAARGAWLLLGRPLWWAKCDHRPHNVYTPVVFWPSQRSWCCPISPALWAIQWKSILLCFISVCGTLAHLKEWKSLSISQPLLFSSFLRYSHCYTVLPWAGQNRALKHAQGGNLSWGERVWCCACGCFNQVGRGLCFA